MYLAKIFRWQSIALFLLLFDPKPITAQVTHTCDEYIGFYMLCNEGTTCHNKGYSYNFYLQIPSSHPDSADYQWLQSTDYNWTVTNGTPSSLNTQNCVVFWTGSCGETGVVSVTATATYENINNSSTLDVIYKCTKTIGIADITTVTIVSNEQIDVVECYDQTPFNLHAQATCGAAYVWKIYNYPYDGTLNTSWSSNCQSSSCSYIQLTPDLYSPVVIGVRGITCQGTLDGPESFYTILRECPDFKIYDIPNSQATPLPLHTAVKDYIYVQPPTGYAKVFNGHRVFFRAGEKIILKPGFEAEKNSVFQAKIKTCGSCDAFRTMPAQQNEQAVLPGLNTLAAFVGPNPFMETITVELNSEKTTESYQLSIQDLSGKIMYSGRFSGTSFIIHTENFIPGIYIVKLWNETGQYYNKLIKVNH